MTAKKRDKHAARCAICYANSDKELNEDYLDGLTVPELAKKYSFEEHTIYRHIRARGLRAKLLNDTLGTVQKFIEKGLELMAQGRMDIRDGSIVQFLRLQAELRKELDTKDPLFIVLQQVEPEARQALAESIKNRFIDVGNQDN